MQKINLFWKVVNILKNYIYVILEVQINLTTECTIILHSSYNILLFPPISLSKHNWRYFYAFSWKLNAQALMYLNYEYHETIFHVLVFYVSFLSTG